LAAEASKKDVNNNDQAKLVARIKELEEALAQKDAEIRHLQDQIDLLSKLGISLEGLSNKFQLSDTQTLNVDQTVVRRVIAGERSGGVDTKSTNAPVPYFPKPYPSQSDISLTEEIEEDRLVLRPGLSARLQLEILLY
jgi:uncharacterized coiled-coil protein SlyX